MGSLDQAAFDAHLRAGCTACGGRALEISSFLDRSVQLMLAEPNDPGRWAHDGEKFVDGTYRMACAACGAVAFESDACPRCNAPGGLARALGEPTRLAVPKRCPSCNELELLAVALVPAMARASAGERPKPAPLAELGEPGYHVVAFACDACDHATVADGCPLCAAPGPLRARP